MKNIDRLLFIPLFAALAIGCSSPNSLQTSEYDDVYYSSKDKTIIKNTEVAAAVQEESDADAINTDAENSVPNPEYSEKNSGTAIAYDNDQDYYSQNYANDDDYYYSSRIRRFHTPYRGLSYYDFAYTDPYWYNRNAGYFGMRSYYDPFYSYDPFLNNCFSCFGYPPIYGGLTVMIGRPFYGGFGYGGLGYGGGFYNGYNRGFYNGFYNGYYANNGWYRNDTNSPRREQYGRRVDRSNVPTGNSGAGSNTVGRPSRNSGGGAIMPGGGGIARPTDTQAGTARPVRGRNTTGNTTIDPTSATQPLEREDASPARTTRRRVFGNDATRVTDPATEGVTMPTEQSRPTRRIRVTSPETEMPNQGERVQSPRRRIEEAPATRTREYEPQQRQERPAVQQRQERPREIYRAEPTYQSPARQERSYDQPSRPSYSPSNSGSSGGGNSGGSSSGGGRGGRPRN